MKTLLITSLAALLVTQPIFADQTNKPKTSGKEAAADSGTVQIKPKSAPAKSGVGPNVKSVAETAVEKVSEKVQLKALGGSDPGAGAGLRVGGKLMTLAEAGIVFKLVEQAVTEPKSPTYYQIPEQTKQALVTVLTELGFKYEDLDKAKSAILETQNRDRMVYNDSIVDISTIKSQYRAVVKSFGSTLDESAFVLAAYSKQGKCKISLH